MSRRKQDKSQPDAVPAHPDGSAIAEPDGFIRLLLKTIGDGILLTGSHDEIRTVNQVFCGYLGKLSDELINEDFSALLQRMEPGAREHWLRLREKVRQEGACQNVPFTFTTAGKKRTFTVNATLAGEGAADGAHSILSCWRPRSAQTEQTEAARGLETKRREPAADRLKDPFRFLAGLGHDIRTPLNAVMGFADLLGTQLKETRQHDYLNLIRKSGNRLQQLLDDVVVFCKIEAGLLKLNSNRVNLEALCGELKHVYDLEIKNRQLEWVQEVDWDMPTLLLDEEQFRRLLLILLDSAVMMTGKGYVKLSMKIKVRNSKKNTLDLVVRVEDSGESEEAEKEQFEPGRFTGVNELKRVTAKRLAGMMKGRLVLRHKGKQGHQAQLLLKDVPTGGQEASPLEEAPYREPAQVVFKGGRILVADDMASCRILISEWCTYMGLEFLEALDGREAVSRANEENPDLILMDIRMPVMSGAEAARMLKHNPKTRHIPIIALSAHGNENDEEGDDVFDGFLLKPLDYTGLIHILARYLPAKITTTQEPSKRDKDGEKITVSPSAPSAPAPDRSHGRPPRIIRPEQLRQALDNDIDPLWKGLQGVIIMNRVVDFAQRLLQLAETHQVAALFTYARQLREYADAFDVANIRLSLGRFPDLTAQIRDGERESAAIPGRNGRE